jgi:hypothetical protein
MWCIKNIFFMKTLIKHLYKVEIELSNWFGGYSGEDFSAEEFRSDLRDRIAGLKKGIGV